ncbi:MAG: hypothetical protein MRERV_20c007 [Mycoplasmataceae bacterium RV_VA103A]|nr:MAG: hypothetical protein MRERV_20c007 [Mycoplasmataceae bacterium RV_VA103A]
MIITAKKFACLGICLRQFVFLDTINPFNVNRVKIEFRRKKIVELK